VHGVLDPAGSTVSVYALGPPEVSQLLLGPPGSVVKLIISKDKAPAAPAPMQNQAAPPVQAATAANSATPGPAKPSPEVFAVMRNGHEVIRGLMKDCETAPDMAMFRRDWGCLMKWQELHAMQEDGAAGGRGFFAVINERFQNVAHTRGMHAAHANLQPIEQQLVQMVNDPRTTLEMVRPVYAQFMQHNEAHLKNEEDVMMPCIKAMKEGGVNLVQVLQTDIMPCIWDNPDFGFWVQQAAVSLEKHHGGQPRALVFLHALMAVCGPERWARCLPFVRAGLTPQTYAQINAQIGME